MTTLSGRLEQGALAVDKVDTAAKDIRKTLSTLRLLALNARIEAARASEYGKGFGVVAQEMTSLADRGDTVTGRIESELDELRGVLVL